MKIESHQTEPEKRKPSTKKCCLVLQSAIYISCKLELARFPAQLRIQDGAECGNYSSLFAPCFLLLEINTCQKIALSRSCCTPRNFFCLWPTNRKIKICIATRYFLKNEESYPGRNLFLQPCSSSQKQTKYFKKSQKRKIVIMSWGTMQTNVMGGQTLLLSKH